MAVRPIDAYRPQIEKESGAGNTPKHSHRPKSKIFPVVADALALDSEALRRAAFCADAPIPEPQFTVNDARILLPTISAGQDSRNGAAVPCRWRA